MTSHTALLHTKSGPKAYTTAYGSAYKSA